MTSVCFTGTGYSRTGEHLTRPVWESRAADVGYSVFEKVRAGLTYLVTADPRSGSLKATNARTLGVTLIDYATFESMMQQTIANRNAGSDMDEVMREAGRRATVAPSPRALSIQAAARNTYAVVFDNGSRQGFNTYDEARRMYDAMRGQGGPASPRPPERHPIRNVPSLRPYGSVRYACNNREFSMRSAAERYRDDLIREEDQDIARQQTVLARDLATEREAAGQCIPHGFALDECNACRENARAAAELAERRKAEKAAALAAKAAERAEKQRIEDAKLAPIGVLKGRRRMNLEGDD